MIKVIRFLFKPPRLKRRLPLLPLEPSSEHSRYAPAPRHQQDIEILRSAGLARTRADAERILRRYPGVRIGKVVKAMERKRRRKPALVIAWYRLRWMLRL